VADVILFNRCDESLNKADIRRALKILNNRAEIYFENVDGKLDYGLDEFKLASDGDVCEITDEIFCPWFVDCVENAEKYYDKRICLKLMVTYGEGLKENQFYGGRLVAVCCRADAQFIGFVCQYNGFAENGENQVVDKNQVLDVTKVDDANQENGENQVVDKKQVLDETKVDDANQENGENQIVDKNQTNKKISKPKQKDWVEIEALISKGGRVENKGIILLDVIDLKIIETPEDIYMLPDGGKPLE
ncbi:MAG: hypothetical protein K6F77_02590, partial [Lachnospiraceae bacterium]|nr:hypothetical protein [Lachnospiraceae bacterium]